jgi:hypothetical protein
VPSEGSVFLENETGFHELQYTTVLELSKWGRFELAVSREKADLIRRLDNGNHVRVVPEGQFPSNKDVHAFTDEPVHKTDGGKVNNGHLLDGLREAFDSYAKSRR